ncbi:hypothetical protein RI129_001607 [Pyrocoelia pectoralis]|uniref:Lamin-B receptor n=1 Tax=Pyrocoelia pectoralis TaxID=417401 RepID=A0AAN7VXJ9_9COLE
MVSKGAKQEKSPQRSPKKGPVKTYRKSPSRAVKSKSPTRISTNSPPSSPRPRRSIRQSPSRITSTPKKSPSRRSPSRNSSSRIDKNKSNVPERLTRASSKSRQEIESETDDDIPSIVTSEILAPKVRGRPKKITTDVVKEPQIFLQNITSRYREATPEIGSYINLIRRSATKSLTHEIDHIDHFKRESSTSSIRKLTELSDEDDVLNNDDREKSILRKSEPRLIDKITPNEFGPLRTLLSIFSLPLLVLAFSVFWNEAQRDYTKSPDWLKYKFLSTYFDITIIVITLCYALLIFLIAALPFGGPKISGLPNKRSKLNYTMNGFFTLIVVGIILLVLETSTDIHVIENILQKHFQLYVTLIVFAVILSIVIHIRSLYAPLCCLKSDALINSGIYNFYYGREINPRLFGSVDVKLCLHRFCCISAILMNIILLYKSVSFNILTDGDIDFKCNETVIVSAAIQIIYFIYYIIFESVYVTTFTAQYEAVGYEYVVYMLTGSLFEIASTKYIFDYGVTRPRWLLILTVTLFAIGFLFYCQSNLQKHQFRLNPYHPKVSHLESLPTSQGRKLLVSGYWGIVRNPNYLGDIMIQLSFGLLVYNAIPVLVYVFDILLLFDRARLIGQKCQQKYGSAWDRYCQRVKYS